MRRALAIASLAIGCEGTTVATNVSPDSLDLATAPAGLVAGDVDGARFTLREAWFRVDRRESRARVDLVLSEGRATRLCANSDPPRARHVLVRFPGAQGFTVGVQRGAPGATSPVTASFESHASGRWNGRPGAVAIEVLTATATQITGRMRACFGPGSEGCVAGSFQARLCVTELDVDGPLSGNVRPSSDDGGTSP